MKVEKLIVLVATAYVLLLAFSVAGLTWIVATVWTLVTT